MVCTCKRSGLFSLCVDQLRLRRGPSNVFFSSALLVSILLPRTNLHCAERKACNTHLTQWHFAILTIFQVIFKNLACPFLLFFLSRI